MGHPSFVWEREADTGMKFVTGILKQTDGFK